MSSRRTWAAEHNARALEDGLAEFRERREATVAQLEGLPAEAFGRTAQHPRLGQPMRLADLLFFQAEHDDYHLARMSDLRRQWGV